MTFLGCKRSGALHLAQTWGLLDLRFGSESLGVGVWGPGLR